MTPKKHFISEENQQRKFTERKFHVHLEHGKLCFLQHEILHAARNQLATRLRLGAIYSKVVNREGWL